MEKQTKRNFISKKTLVILLEYILTIECFLIVFLILKAQMTTIAQDNQGIKWGYSLVNGYAEDVYYDSGKLNNVVEIPDTLDGYPVISVKGAKADKNIFNSYENTSVKKIIIPPTIQTIGGNSFKGCINLETMVIPDSVINIGENSFKGCINLTSIKLSQNMTTLSNCLFDGCINLKSISIPDDVRIIGNQTFANCNNLEKIKLPEGLETIGDGTFSYCYHLGEIELSNHITSIGEYPFSYCKSLTQITLPNKIERIGYNAFLSCVNLSTVNMSSGITAIGNQAFQNCINLENITLPDTIVSIGKQAFMNCTKLQHITIPDNMISIEKATFYHCKQLSTISFGKKIENIRTQAFAECSKLNEINLSGNVKNIEAYAFYHCNNVTQFKISASNPYYIIQNGILYDKNKTELISNMMNKENTINIPNTVIMIKEGAFLGNEFIEKVVIPEKIEVIEKYAFSECNKLTDIYIEKDKSDVEINNNWITNSQPYIHDLNCRHSIIPNNTSGIKINHLPTKVSCQDNYSFQLIGDMTNLKVRILSEGQYVNSDKVSQILKPDENGNYTIERINRNKEIIIEEKNKAGGVIVHYIDEKGNSILKDDSITGIIGEEYQTTQKQINGYKLQGNLPEDIQGKLQEDIITVTYQYYKIENSAKFTFMSQMAREDIQLYIIAILFIILVNIILYLYKDSRYHK